MSYLKTPFKLGKLTLRNNIFYAPLAGCSDYPFRKMSAKYQPGLMYCEMTKMEAVIRRVPSIMRMLDYSEEMHPIGGQLCGSNPAIAGEAARIIEELGFDVVDFNCGCPVDKITNDGSGSGMLRTPDKIGEIIANMVAAVKIPVTVKVRAGWDEKSINVAEVTRIAEQAGAVAICVHGRTREQAYRGPAKWDWIKEAKQAAKNILVIGNGDLFSADAGQRMFDHTGCDALLVSRGTLGRPWIVEEMYRHLQGLDLIPKTADEVRQHLLEHFEHVCQYHDERRTIVDMRRIGCWYVSASTGSKTFRGIMSKALSLDQIRELIHNHSFEV